MTPADLKAARLRLGFRSRRALAEAMGVTKWTVDSWEMGRRPIPEIAVRFLNCLSQNPPTHPHLSNSRQPRQRSSG